MSVDNRAIMAARNSADLYTAIFSSHLLRFERNEFSFFSIDMPPPYYSNLVVTSEGREIDVIDVIKSLSKRFMGKVGFKDSFGEFDLSAHGFNVLFEASWFWRPPIAFEPVVSWSKIQTKDDLRYWEEAWKVASPTDHRMFRPSILADDNVGIFAKFEGDTIVAGAIGNRSQDCIGLSNVFSNNDRPIFSEAAQTVSSFFGDAPLVGYMSKGGLPTVLAAGFETTGSLRILAAERAHLEAIG